MNSLLRSASLPVEAALPKDFEEICAVLTRSGLPVDDLTEASLGGFLIYKAGDVLAGVVGLERYDDSVLLRSLAVSSAFAGRGIGKQLMAAAEARARALPASSLYLLTLTAEKYFDALGYRRVPRERAPDAIKHSRQFASLCPSTAVLMVKP
jgi:amino-acid N-acetyltransferase